MVSSHHLIENFVLNTKKIKLLVYLKPFQRNPRYARTMSEFRASILRPEKWTSFSQMLVLGNLYSQEIAHFKSKLSKTTTSTQMPVPKGKVQPLILEGDRYWKITLTWMVKNNVEDKSNIRTDEGLYVNLKDGLGYRKLQANLQQSSFCYSTTVWQRQT